MNRLTASIEAELALIRRALHDATHNRVTSKLLALPALLARIFRPDEPVVSPQVPTPREQGVYAWDARGNLVPLRKGGATHSGNIDVISPAPGTRGSGISNPRRID